MTVHHPPARVREHDAPRQTSRLPPQLPVHEVRTATKEKADRGADRGEVAHGRDGQVQAPAGKRPADDGTHKPTVEAHTPLAEHRYLDGIFEVVPSSIEEHVA